MQSATRSVRHIAIVGGGFSGTMLALQLARRGVAATLIERRDEAGRGTAYSTPHDVHLLNVRAGNMSAWADDPGHFARWLEAAGKGDAAIFAKRKDYGAYLRDQLASTESVTVVTAEVRDIKLGDGATLHLADGTAIQADVAVLATGNLPPHTLREVAAADLPHARYAANPWSEDALDGLGDDDAVLILGTGLTMVDVALTLDARGFKGTIHALSRRGLLPRGHVDGPAQPVAVDARGVDADLVGAVRKAGRGGNWRAAVDALRPVTQALWRNSDLATRSRFLRHLRAWWDVHRHRIAPAIADRIAAMQASGALHIQAGKLVGVREDGSAVSVEWRPRGSERTETLRVSRIVNCTGPQADLSRTDDPLLGRLAERGLVRPDPLRIGIDIDPDGHALDVKGEAQPGLYAIGPMTRSAHWEIVAVPDIRHQVAALADRLAE